MLKFQNARKKYGNHLIVDIPSLEIKPGFYWLKGTNGSGKSTFLKMTAGLIPFDGEVELDGINLKKQPTEYRRQVSYEEAEPLYPAYVSGLDLVHFYNSARKANKNVSDTLIEKLGIGEFYKNPVGTYSSGMVKKLSLVLAFIGQSQFIFLDEPLVTLDQASVKILYSLIENFHQQGVSFILTSHQSVEHNHLDVTSLSMKEKTVWFQ